MKIRAYTADDDAALMALERLCPRGEPTPFVHYRRRFVDRAALFARFHLVLAEAEGQVVAAGAAAIKETAARGQPLRLAYLFDIRVAPALRGRGLATRIVEQLHHDAAALGCEGSYAHIVATNRASLALFTRLGYARRRQLRYLTYPPLPLLFGAPVAVTRHARDCNTATHRYESHDLWVPDVACALAPYGLERWQTPDGDAAILLYDQSQLFQQVAADAPWPTPDEMARRGRHWRLFHPHGPAAKLEALFATLRDEAVGANIRKLTFVADAEEPIPSFWYAEASEQREYVIVTRSTTPRWDGTFGPNLYCDTREL